MEATTTTKDQTMLPLTVEDRLEFLRRGFAFLQSYALGQGTSDECPSEDAWAGLAEHCDHMLRHIRALKAALMDVLGEDAPDPEEDEEDNDDDDDDDNGAGDDESEDDVPPARDRPKPRRLRRRGAR